MVKKLILHLLIGGACGAGLYGTMLGIADKQLNTVNEHTFIMILATIFALSLAFNIAIIINTVLNIVRGVKS